ncbi:MAG: nuclease-related domain-containing protein, partial [Undibacterium sp.]
MKIKVLNPDGVHAREIKGLEALKDSLPNHWYGYASLELIGENGGEIDLVICAEDRLIAVEIKDWNGRIEDLGPYWRTSGRDQKSPVVTIAEKAKKLASKLKTFLAPEHLAPWVDHCVLLTGKSRRNDLSDDSKAKTFELDYFKRIGKREVFRECFTHEAWSRTPILDLKSKLDHFFAGPRVRPLSCSYNGYKANDDPCYTHPKKIYSEYFADKEGAKGFRALLRRWDFDELGNVDAAYLNKENRATLALREENAIGYLRDAKPELAGRNVFLAPISNEGRGSVTANFFELYDLPGDLRRLKESLRRFGDGLKDDNRISIARLLLSHFSELHDLEVTHRDIGDHCIWVSMPDK